MIILNHFFLVIAKLDWDLLQFGIKGNGSMLASHTVINKGSLSRIREIMEGGTLFTY